MSSGRDALQQTFSFSDAHAVASSITKNFEWFLRDPDQTGQPETWAHPAGEVLVWLTPRHLRVSLK